MAQVATLDTLLAARTLWHAGRSAKINAEGEADAVRFSGQYVLHR